ncbi:hypothetical protein FDK21_15635 [Cohaesibacter sp. CAU 1516]|uniref:hypothetical protein n=1 Tax=Cohaesibacter sp. CAU 1516 TaxID=2576038 RepID=UPI0010FE39B6|nr:hypothetical protein [Cohaesibacter sp. CAU 1516]TLP44228.1 hypothetical protein FDK21_15635 [Cohaesibacter sp. CAU 1516]
MTLRPSLAIVSLLCVLTVLLGAALLHAGLSPMRQQHASGPVRQLGLSDLALFTEARYTRHPTMADLHTPFQDHPVSIDHFPTGSLVGPPQHLRQLGGQMTIEGVLRP